MAHETHGASTAKTLPADLSAPAFVDGWRSRALMVAGVAAIVAVILAFLGQAQDQLGWDHFMRAWMLGLVLTFGWAVGGLALLMVQYCSGGKWGLAAAPSSRSRNPHPAAGLRLLGRLRYLHEAALPVGALHQSDAIPPTP